jgi:hypothetical protein
MRVKGLECATFGAYHLVKSFISVFSLRREKCFSGGHVLEGHGWDGVLWDQLLVN